MNKPDQIYEELIEYENKIHKQNLKRIKRGLRSIIIIPLIFLFLLFLTESNKVIFLILWITSLFVISAYLIFVEYTDYNVQQIIKELTNRQSEARSLLETDYKNKEELLKQAKASIVSTLSSAFTLDATDSEEKEENVDE